MGRCRPGCVRLNQHDATSSPHSYAARPI
jgi:hypothetical protein